MKSILTIFLLFILCACQSENQFDMPTESQSSKQNFKKDLEKYNGYYSSVERTDGKISVSSLPKALFKNKKLPESVTIEYLSKIQNGYIFNFTVDFGEYITLVVSTLNLRYELIDFKMYPNGRNLKNRSEDTITVLTYNDNTISVQLMHPNEINESDFSENGIRQEELKIDDKTMIIK